MQSKEFKPENIIIISDIMIPKAKKTLNAFLVGEEGKIPKESIIKLGTMAAGATALAAGIASAHNSYYDHSESISPKCITKNLACTSTHAHAPVHDSWDSHSSAGGGGGTM
jgi:hypothetical protein